ncbi:hypothetical protein IGI04_040901 [Brassica rapa subsp. trilocularis]|uniref:Transmembrane protein n=1 Tax=Brassica rapa subsp. trilocularis TaxID=1813537 RepID=A0ABQ7KSM8_BRACM|nr:hypothetical protein IGI04_040901 [Brassica rapa subsp. trilocularis]
MPSFAFGSHHHLANPTDSPYTVEISIDGDSSDLDSLSEVDLESGGVTKLHSGGGKKRRTRRRKKKKKRKKKKETFIYIVSMNLSRTCEICGAMAINVAGDQSNPESTASTHSQVAAGQTQSSQTEPRGIWHGRRVMNFLLAAMVFAFIVSWLFHFKVLK